MQQSSTAQPLTGLPATGLPAHALVVGDPARAAQVAERLTDSRELARRREFRSFTGTWNGTSVVVASHGVGAPGAMCLFHELADGGARSVVRLGTAGALQPQVGDGDLVIGEACVRDDGVTSQLVADTYPAYADAALTKALADAAEKHAARAHRGVVWTRAAFYPGLLDLGLQQYVEAGVLAIEMELAALLVFAALHGLRAAGVLVVDGAAADGLRDSTGYDPHRPVVRDAVDVAIQVALDGLVGGS